MTNPSRRANGSRGNQNCRDCEGIKMNTKSASELDAMHEKDTADITRVNDPVTDACDRIEAREWELRTELRPWLAGLMDMPDSTINLMSLQSLQRLADIKRQCDSLPPAGDVLHERLFGHKAGKTCGEPHDGEEEDPEPRLRQIAGNAGIDCDDRD
jgi:hypothetical protein